MRFFGAAGGVTGSCTLLEGAGARVLVDLGLFQGGASSDRLNRRFPPVRPQGLDAVVLTHAHLDHSGRLPMLASRGYTGPIFATPATVAMCEILLRDAAHLQQADAERESRQRARAGRGPVRPLFSLADVERVLGLFRPVRYGQEVEVASGVRATFVDAGHILGSASIRLDVREGSGRVVVFSGDIGPRGAPLLRDPEPIPDGEVVVLESTYGDRDHRPREESEEELAGIIRSARHPEGKVIIPSFAVGRTQQLIYTIGGLLRRGRLSSVRVYVDSPMAITTTELYERCRRLYDEEATDLLASGGNPLDFEGLHLARSVEESRAINGMGDGVVVISAAGMCTGGRVLHHLKHSLWKPQTHLVFVGFQAEGTLGRRLVEGARRVTVLGTPIVVKAQVHTLNGFSAHAGQTGLVEWLAASSSRRPRVLLNHGEDRQRRALQGRIASELGLEAHLPEAGEIVEI